VAPAVHVSRPAGGTLPFTGAQLGVFLLVGLGLIAVGLLLRHNGREARNHP
jgi:hypothetical protein